MIRVEGGDCRDVIPRLAAEGVVCDACVTDPPYHLQSGNLTFDWGALGEGGHRGGQRGQTNSRGRKSGFMGQTWDGGDIAFRPETWATVATILRPGGFLLAFGGTRTHHRMVCAIEDAGFVIQDTISFLWAHGNGFPKRRNMLKPAAEPLVCAQWPGSDSKVQIQPIAVAYKPGGKRTLQVDECRIEGVGNKTFDRFPGDRSREQYRTGTTGAAIATDLGRWPANLVTDGSDEVLTTFPDAPGQQGDIRGTEPSVPFGGVFYGYGLGPHSFGARSDSGSAARFFYQAKADKEDRWGSRHPTVKPVALLKWLVPLVTPPDGLFIDPFAGSGTAAVAALATGRRAILIEREPQYVADIRERVAHYEGDGRHSLAAKARRTPERPVGGLFGLEESR